MRANISLMCGENSNIKNKYIQYIKDKNIQYRIVSYDSKALELYDTLKLTKAKRERVIRQCILDVEKYLLEGQNIFIDIPLLTKKDRISFLYNRRKMMRENELKCWCSLILFSIDGVEIPEANEGWNDILIYKNNNFQTISCHSKLIM